MRSMSVIVPCYNEEAVIGETYSRLVSVFAAEPYEMEFLFVDDGSRDQTLNLLKGIAEVDPRVRILSFSRNFGHQSAVVAGLVHCIGSLVAIIDADLQDPPEAIPQMVALMDERKCSVVYGKRVTRKGEGVLKRITAHVFYRVLNSLSDIPFPVDTGDFRVMDRKVVDAFNALPERNKYIRGLIAWIGFQQVPYLYVREPRFAGKTKYSVSRMVKFAFSALFSFSRRPLRLAMQLGTLSVVISLLILAWLIFEKIFHLIETVPGWTSTVAVVVFVGGVQLLSTGVLGEYIGSIFDEAKRRPDYVIAECIQGSAGGNPDGHRLK